MAGLIAYQCEIMVALAICAAGCRAQEPTVEQYRTMRQHMVASQVERRGVSDKRVLAAMSTVERHRFVPEKYRSEAYSDGPLSIGHRQTISQPYIVALMSDLADCDNSDKILEIGTGSGYQAAVLAELCDSVFSIEIIEELGRRSARLLKELGYGNVRVKIGDGYKGWKEHAPFNAILVTCAPTKVPKPLQDQLAEGGRLVIPVGEKNVQELVLITKRNGVLQKTKVIPVRFVPMVDEKGKLY